MVSSPPKEEEARATTADGTVMASSPPKEEARATTSKMASSPPTEEVRATTADGTVIPLKFVTKPFPYHFQVKFRIDSLSDMGWGRGHIEDDSENLPEHPKDWGVRVPFVLPGELVMVKIFKNMDDHSEGMKRVVLDCFGNHREKN
jgi:hypothetical protein